eukprot:COSAG02_NODE_2805_length_7995_cov_6.051178_2_plen_103_part_00
MICLPQSMLDSMWSLQGFDTTAAEVHHGYSYADRDAGRRPRSASGSVHGDRRRQSAWGASPQRDTGSRRGGYGDEADFEVSSQRSGYGDRREKQTGKSSWPF